MARGAGERRSGEESWVRGSGESGYSRGEERIRGVERIR